MAANSLEGQEQRELQVLPLESKLVPDATCESLPPDQMAVSVGFVKATEVLTYRLLGHAILAKRPMFPLLKIVFMDMEGM